MGKIVGFDEEEKEDDSEAQNLGDLLAEMATSEGESIDAVQAVREIRKRSH